LFHSALETPPAERAAFLDQACGGDKELRREVDSLLAADAEATGASEKIPARIAAEMLSEDQTGPVEERKIRHYRIISRLGAGGMGEVYLAHNTRLGRKVAIKFLPEQFTGDADRMWRFELEARAASALNNSHVATIYDICEEDGAHFIVMEYVEGENLADTISRRHLDAAEVVEIGLQVADALDEAHSKGITHRDIKPANLMLNDRGQVKVLDFGLAKLTGPFGQSDDSQHIARIETAPGLVMGTVAYMSPEQALGREVDLRTDIFSLGVVLYELAAGRRPFTGDTATETIDRILHAKPAAVTRLNDRMPKDLERIIARCLEKDRELRYRSSGELINDLKRLQMQSLTSRPKFVSDLSSLDIGQWLSRQSRFKSGWARLVFAVLILAIGVAVYLRVVHPRLFPPRTDIDSLAVLPLANLSNDKEEEYLADGMTDELISNLMGIGALRVISRTSVVRYKGTHKPIPEIAMELNVDALVEGSVRRTGEKVRISVRLIRGATDQHLWIKNYESNRSEILMLQSLIAQDIATEIQIKITPQERDRLTRVATVNPEALQLYLMGRFFWRQRTGDGISKSVDYFLQAIDKDPNFAPAYSGLADSYIIGMSNLSESDAMEKAKAAATKALTLDDTLAEAHASLAAVKMLHDWDWPGALAGFKRAIDLKPGYVTAHHWFAEYLTAMGRNEEALAEITKAQELDPFSVIISRDIGQHYFYRGLYDRAIEQSRRTMALQSDFFPAHMLLALSYAKKRMFAEAIAAINEAEKLSSSSNNRAILGYVYALAGRRLEAQQALDALIELSRKEAVSPHWIAAIYGELGDKDRAFTWLEKAFDNRDGFLAYLKVHPALESLRSDPRFRDLTRRVGLPD
jgi:serine/threonine-protein kinase